MTFYDDATGERTELSAATFANWVSKTANLLVDGLGLGAGDVAAVRLPVHWQTLVVLAGCWSVGLEVRTSGGPADVAFVAEPSAPESVDATDADATDTVALSLRPLGAGLRAAAADGAIDYAAEVRTYGDRFAGPPIDQDSTALDGRSHRDLLQAALGVSTRGDRLLVAFPKIAETAAPEARFDADLAIRTYLAPLAGGGSIVLCRNADPAVMARRTATERAVSE